MINIKVRQGSGAEHQILIAQNSSVKELKEVCSQKTGISATEQKLIYKGKILKDEMTLDDYKIEEGSTLHIVKSQSL